jgi:hypothetical protein
LVDTNVFDRVRAPSAAQTSYPLSFHTVRDKSQQSKIPFAKDAEVVNKCLGSINYVIRAPAIGMEWNFCHLQDP